jgi:hypothetical protein
MCLSSWASIPKPTAPTGGGQNMHSHQANCLRGPISRKRRCWPQAPAKPHAVDQVPRLSDLDIRADLVKRIRREIAEGTYETPEKWQAALDRLLDRLA